jgi:dipeptidyl aminopeptidase/acylaminoacyl peptidase
MSREILNQARWSALGHRFAAWILLSLCVGVAAAHPAAFTIDQVMQAPFASSLVAAPRDKAVAWVLDARGSRNVWVADATHGMKARAITAFSGDDGFNIGELAWSPDSQLIAFTRGQTLEDERGANVTSSPVGPVPREVWVVSSAGGDAHKVGAGHSPAFSPDGSRLVFVDKDRIWTVAPKGSAEPQALVVDNGQVASLTFSSDGRRLAFVSDRARHTLVGVYDFSTQRIAWMGPSLDHDSSPVFSPTGSQVAFIRVPAYSGPEFVSRRSGEPWSIWVADAASSEAHRVWRADAGPGSVFHPTLSDTNLLWTRGGTLVFPWEKTGWLQLYALPTAGGTAVPLTSGSFEVANLAISPDRAHIIYSSNQGDEDRLHVFRVDEAHKPAVRLGGDEPAIEDAPQLTADGTVFALRGGATQPLQAAMLSGSHWQTLAPETMPSSFPHGQLITPQSVTFQAKDGQIAHGQLFLPRDGGASTRHPAVLFFHGGPRRQMLLGFHPMDAYSWMYALNQYFAAEGYVVLSVNYRGGIGYGLDYREARDFGPDGASELNDLLGAISYLQSRGDVDRGRLGIWGGSYGGLMTALGLARASDALAAGVDYAGLYNWATFFSSVGLLLPDAAATQRAVESSPIATIDRWRSPVLVVQADDDRDVPSQQSSELIEALRIHRIEHDELILPNEIHDLARYASWMQFFQAADRYFDEHLAKRTTARAQ